MYTTEAHKEFKEDIRQGLTSHPKTISSKYFYDARGDKLFREIMELDEYYLTDCEYEILRNDGLAKSIAEGGGRMEVVELGAGDGSKSIEFLSRLMANGVDLVYKPVDISNNTLKILKENVQNSIAGIEIVPQVADYQTAIRSLHEQNGHRSIILFLGSSIGNFSVEDATDFIRTISERMSSQDRLIIGFDLKKNPHTILRAYNDSLWVTAKFNLNLLTRMNRELKANFDVDQFIHYPLYDPQTGTAKSYIVSTEEQKVYLKELDLHVRFEEWEAIHTEISQKYDRRMIEKMADDTGLEVQSFFTDSKEFFADCVFRKKKQEKNFYK